MKKLDQSIGDDFFFNIGLKSNGAIVCLFVCLVYSKGAQLQLTGIFCFNGYIQNEFIHYSVSQSYMAASFSTKGGPRTRRRVVGGPFNGRPLPE